MKETVNRLQYVHSPSKGKMSFKEMLEDLREYMLEDQNSDYDIVIGTDSQQHLHTDFVTAVVVHRVGAGGRYYWVRERQKPLSTLRQRIWLEAVKSLEAATELSKSIYKLVEHDPRLRFNLEIHVDVGENGKTRDLIKEVVGMIRGNGFTVRTKPLGYGAFVVADRHT